LAGKRGISSFAEDSGPDGLQNAAQLLACYSFGRLQAQTTSGQIVPRSARLASKTGKGLTLKLKRKMMRGSGVAQILETRTKQFHVLDKFMVNLKKLRSNILEVKYTTSGNVHTKVPVQKITSESREMITDILNGAFNKRLFEKMDRDDKRVIKNFVRRCHIDVDVTDSDDDDFEKEFQILKGEYLSGNDNPKLKKDLKRYVIVGINENRLPRNQGMLLLYELSL
jgi:hypothetical protein